MMAGMIFIKAVVLSCGVKITFLVANITFYGLIKDC